MTNIRYVSMSAEVCPKYSGAMEIQKYDGRTDGPTYGLTQVLETLVRLEISRKFSNNFTSQSRSQVIFISLSLLKKERKQNLFTLHFSKKSESQNLSLVTCQIKVKAYFSLLKLFKPTLAGA